MTGVHPLCEALHPLSLDLDMNPEAGSLAVVQAHLDQGIGLAVASRGLARKLAQLRLEKRHFLAPVDLGLDFGEE